MNKTQRFGAGGGAGDKFKMDRIQLFVTGDFISIDLRGCQMPTPRPRPHIPVLYREGGFTPPELYDAIEAADAWMYSRNIGVLSRCVSFTLGEWEKEISPRGEVMERSRVYGEIEEFTEFLPVRKSKFYGAFVLNRRVYLHAIDAPPARWRGDAGSSPLDGASTAASSPRHPTHWLISTQVPAPRRPEWAGYLGVEDPRRTSRRRTRARARIRRPKSTRVLVASVASELTREATAREVQGLPSKQSNIAECQ